MSDHAASAGTFTRSRFEGSAPENMTARLQSASPALPPIHQLRDRSLHHGYSLGSGPVLPPPRPSSQASTDSDQRSTRTLASVHSILNPTSGDDAPPYRSRKHSMAQMDGESAYASPHMHETMLNRPRSATDGRSELSPPNYQGSRGAEKPRRILTPISPTLHRTSVSHRVVTPGTIDARGTPFLSSSSAVHTVEPGAAGIPPLPPMPVQHGHRQPYGYSPSPNPSAQPTNPRRKSVSVMSAGPPGSNVSHASSARASPTPSSYSSYSRSGQASPTYPYPPTTAPTPPGSYSLAPSPGPGSVPATSLEGESSSTIPMVSAGQNAYELVSINTARGMVSLPVEVHVASRQADEKRKRNAGASARFRQRRKEKEKEANTTIDKLRDQLRMAQQDADYYKNERDRYLNIVKASPGWERYLPRSPSPASKRGPMEQRDISTEGMTPSSPQSATSSEQRRPAEHERNTRPRTDAYSLPMPSPTSTQPAAQHYPSPYTPYSPGGSAPPRRGPFSPTASEARPASQMSQQPKDGSLPPKSAYTPAWSPPKVPASHA